MSDEQIINKLDQIEKQLAEIIRQQIKKDEMDQLGHRIVYDTETGRSKNIWGGVIDPSKLDKDGFQINTNGNSQMKIDKTVPTKN